MMDRWIDIGRVTFVVLWYDMMNVVGVLSDLTYCCVVIAALCALVFCRG